MEFQLEQARQVLGRTPQTIDSLLRPLSEAWTTPNEGPETWSPFDVVGHLIHGEETDWIPRARLIVEHGDERAFEPFDRFAMFEKSKGKTLAELLDEFAHARRQSLAILDSFNLTPEVLGKKGRHPELGVVTLKQLLATWVVHDLGHVSQVVRVMAKQYSDQVGPWTAYLSILGRSN